MFDFDQFFAMSDAFDRGALTPTPVGAHEDPFSILSGEAEPSSLPRRYRRHLGKDSKDFLFADDLTVLISDRAASVLTAAGVTGWATYPVEVLGLAGREVGVYHGLVVRGRATIDNDRSQLSVVPPPVPEGFARKAWMGLYFHPDSWDQSDMFLLQGTIFTIVTQAVKRVIENARLSNVAFDPLDSVENHP